MTCQLYQEKIEYFKTCISGGWNYDTYETDQPIYDNFELHCNVCGKGFHHSESLRPHLKMHTGETKCNICGKTLSRKFDLKKHIENVHKIGMDTYYSQNN
jgi:uncharacterized Zn-finger protein